MKLFGPQDLSLIGALTAALIVIFSSPILRMLDYAREIERQSGLTLIPALALLMVAFLFHQYRRNAQEQAKADAAEAATRAAQHRAAELERLVSFGQSLGRSLDFESIRVAIGSHLHELAGTDKIWVLVREGNKWQALSGDTRGAEQVLQWDDLAEQLLAGADQAPAEPSAPRTIGIPLIVGGTAMGVLGVTTAAGQLPADKRRILEAAAALLAVSVKNAQLFREVKENSVRDTLTGCFTRGHSLDMIDAELRRARRSETPLTLILFDLDHFKDVNDRHGHLCGDAVLSAVGRRMKDVLRGSDLKCRYGGEEFLVLLPETPLHGARRVAETLRKEIADRPVLWAGEALTVTASFGLAQTLPGEVNVQAVIARADQALYRAKDDGRNCVRIAADTTTLVANESNRTNRVS